MESQNALTCMKIRLKGFRRGDTNTQAAEDQSPCKECASCRPDITEMVTKTGVTYCIVCNKEGRLQCSRCTTAQYCSADCQRADWPVHKLVCSQFASVPNSTRPTDNHFRILLFPVESSQPEFCWAATNNSNELVVQHPTVHKWGTDMKARYKQSDGDPLVIYALSRDFAMKGKRLGHGIRVAFWQPPDGLFGHLEGFNQTILALSGTLSSRKYGPVVAFSYSLDSDFKYTNMDDMTTNDFQHVMDHFHNSDWNPTLGDTDRYPEKTLPALLIPDSTLTSQKEDNRGASICDIIGLHRPVLRVTIAAKINFKQICWHILCNPHTSPIREMCPQDGIWHTFLLGPLLLGLPWMGRNAMLTNVHDVTRSRKRWPAHRWQGTYARSLRQGVRIGLRVLTIDVLNMSDGLIVFNPFGLEVHEMHLRAYDEFIYRNIQRDESERNYTKAEFCKLWEALKTKRTKITGQGMGQDELDFSRIPSPYDVLAEAQPELSQSVKAVFIYVRDLFQDQRFRGRIRNYERKSAFVSELLPARLSIPSDLWQKHLDNLLLEVDPIRAEEKPSSPKVTTTQTEDDLASLAVASLNLMGQ